MKEAVAIHSDVLQQIQDLYEQDRYLDAYALAQKYGDLRVWRGATERVLAGRLAARLGAFRLSMAIHWRAFREHPQDQDAIYYYTFVLRQRVGPARAYEFICHVGDLDGASDQQQAHWLAQRSEVFAAMRDFDAAERDLQLAMQMAPDEPWFWLCRSALSEAEDQYDAAMEAAERALELRPSYVTAAQRVADLLTLRNRLDEATLLLRDAATAGQTPVAWAHLAALYEQQDQPAEALEALERFEAVCPIRDPELLRWLGLRRGYLLYLRGHIQQSIEASRQARVAWLTRLADRMESNRDGRRVVLPVTFVRQHHKTCAPATLSAISRYWQRPAEHLAIADEICYDGTPAYYERRWAEENGYIAREFTVSWDSSVALIDRGIPFTLTTIDPTWAHLQAVIGYDSCRKTLLVRDPYVTHIVEFDMERTLERYGFSGPRGMLLVPRDQASLLEGLTLPDEKVWDVLNRLREALEQHQREAAQSHLEEMRRDYPGHYLVLWAERSLAYYDGSTVDLLAIADRFIERFPANGGAQLLRLSCLRRLGRHAEIVPWLTGICAGAGVDPVFRQELASELSGIPEMLPRSLELIRQVLRRLRGDAGAYRAYANLLWIQRERDRSLVFYRVAACLDNLREEHAHSYFIASRSLRKIDESLAFLRRRFERFGRRSGQPAWTLFTCLEELDRTHEGLEILKEALRLRPDDGDLLLLAAGAYARCHQGELSHEALKRAKLLCARLHWLRTAAAVARHESRLADCLGHAQQALAIDPLAMDMHREAALHLAELKGPTAAVEHLRTAVGQFPHHYPLRQLLVEWQSSEYAPVWEADVRQLVEVHPHDGWARRELALNLLRQRRLDEAMREIECAGKVEPHSPYYHQILGDIQMQRGELDAARNAFRSAISLEADARYAIDRLIQLSPDPESRREALRFLQQELERQVTFGPGLLAYAREVQHVLPMDEVFRHLREANRLRPDLWQSWTALAVYEAQVGQLKEAIATLRAAAERFPLVTELFVELARVCGASGDDAGQLDAWRTAYGLSPRSPLIAYELASALERRGKMEEAIEVLRAATMRTPLDAPTHGALGRMLWDSGQREPAVEEIRKALECDPDYDWARRALRWYGQQLGKPEIGVEIARQMTQDRPGEARAWLALAIALDDKETADRIAAVNKAMELAPYRTDANDLAAQILTQAGRFDDAVAACRPTVWGQQRPISLLGREIWVRYNRGQQQDAIAEMYRLTEADPSYVWGLQQMVAWLQSEPKDERYYKAAKWLVVATPDNAVAFGHLAAAELERNESGAAVGHLQRALELDREYDWAGTTLFRLHMEARRYDKADEVLGQLCRHCPGPKTHLYGVELSLAQRDTLAAVKHAVNLMADKAGEFWMCGETAKLFLRGHALGDLRRAAWHAARKPGASAMAGEMLSAAWIQDGRWLPLYLRLLRLRTEAAAHVQAWARFTVSLGQPTRKTAVALVGAIHYRYLRRSASTFGTYGCTLVSLRWNRLAAWWMRDTLSREGVQPWMVYNYMMVQANIDQDRRARELAAKVLAMPQSRVHTSAEAWLAVWECLDGRYVDAAARLERVSSCNEPEAGFLLLLARSMIELERASASERSQRIVDIRTRVVQAAGEMREANWEPAVVRLYRAAGTVMNRLAGTRLTWPRRA